jgi:hypothetical protein
MVLELARPVQINFSYTKKYLLFLGALDQSLHCAHMLLSVFAISLELLLLLVGLFSALNLLHIGYNLHVAIRGNFSHGR